MPVFVIPPRFCVAPLEYSDGTKPVKPIDLACGRKARGVPELHRDGEGGDIIDPAEAAEPSHARRQRLDRECGLQVRVDRMEPRDDVVNRAAIGRERLLERGQRPVLRASHAK